MELQKLHSDVIAKIKSSLTINTLTQCVIELVSNELKVKFIYVAVHTILNVILFLGFE